VTTDVPLDPSQLSARVNLLHDPMKLHQVKVLLRAKLPLLAVAREIGITDTEQVV
jgi:hypothetical protein